MLGAGEKNIRTTFDQIREKVSNEGNHNSINPAWCIKANTLYMFSDLHIVNQSPCQAVCLCEGCQQHAEQSYSAHAQ